ncbi:hypothetical protein [Streptodolium elevatio]
MTADHLDNPAGRLQYLLLDLGRRYPRADAMRQTSLSTAWSAILDVPEHTPEFFVAVGRFYTLPDQVTAAVNALTNHDDSGKARLLRHIDGIGDAFRGHGAILANPLASLVETFATGCDIPRSAALAQLDNCSYELHRFQAEASAMTLWQI